MKLFAQTVLEYIEKYRHKGIVVRQIHSDKAEFKRKGDFWYTILILIFGAITTFLGFTGSSRLFEIYAAVKEIFLQKPLITSAISKASEVIIFDTLFNFFVLALFVISLLNLVFRWKEEHAEHFQSVVKLTQFLNWLDEVQLLHDKSSDSKIIHEIRSRYQGIVEQLPPNNRKDYKRAKKRLSEIGKDKSIPISPHTTITINPQNAQIESWILASPILCLVLSAMYEVDKGLWLGGGALRNYIWDMLTGRKTPFDDFDIVFYNSSNLSEDVEVELKRKIKELLPKPLSISVKNQARMHLVTGEPARNSLEEAIKNWPETATAIAIRLDAAGEIEFISPYGFDDLLSLVLKPTEYHAQNPAAFNRRLKEKEWKKHWPELHEIIS